MMGGRGSIPLVYTTLRVKRKDAKKFSSFFIFNTDERYIGYRERNSRNGDSVRAQWRR